MKGQLAAPTHRQGDEQGDPNLPNGQAKQSCHLWASWDRETAVVAADKHLGGNILRSFK